MEFLNILGHNREFIFGVYNFGPLLGVIVFFSIIDAGLKGWGMWHAARMGKTAWFIALLLMNSLGILPAIFLLLTKDEYEQLSHTKN